MPKYVYTAIGLDNKTVSDTIEALDDSDFRRIMRHRDLVPVKYKIIEEKGGGYRLKANEAAEFSRQLAGMLGSGITLTRALEILNQRDFRSNIKAVYKKLHRDIQQGVTLSEAMKMQPGVFPGLLINMYASGEASGKLENVASKMAMHYEKEHRLNGSVKSAMTYPIVLLVMTVVIVMIIFTFILPRFFDMFKNMELPAVTQALVNISVFMQHYWYSVIIIGLAVFAFIRYLVNIPAVELALDKLKLNLPVVGRLLRIIYTARFARTLSSLYASGISMINALEITTTVIGNKYIENQFSDVVRTVRNGEPLSAAVGAVDGFDKKLSTTILIGEESGRLDSMLESTSESFDYEAESATGRLVQLLQPVMIVIMALVIGFVMMGVMLPIFSLYQKAGSL